MCMFNRICMIKYIYIYIIYNSDICMYVCMYTVYVIAYYWVLGILLTSLIGFQREIMGYYQIEYEWDLLCILQ